jgi:hypothetical protein
MPFDPGRRRGEASREGAREERLIRLLGIAAGNRGYAVTAEDLVRDALQLERELLRALRGRGE